MLKAAFTCKGAINLKAKLAAEKATSSKLAEECKALKLERAGIQEELARFEENLAKVFGEKVSLEAEMEF